MRDSDIQKALGVVGNTNITVSMFNDHFSYQLTSDMVASKQITNAFSTQRNKQELGGSRFLSSADVAHECMKFRKGQNQ